MRSDLERRFVDVFSLAALQAGAVARRLQGRIPAETKAGDSAEGEALTAVDLAAQDVILHLLHRELPEVAMDAEERTESVALFAGADPGAPLVVVDPIDGTLNYIKGSDDFAVMGALLREGRYRAAVVHFPARGGTYWAIAGAGCFRRTAGGERRCDTAGAADRILYTPRTPRAWRRALAGAATALALSRCSAVDASAPATGRACASVAEAAADRRRAIGLFLTLAAGGVVWMNGRRWAGEDPERHGGQGALTVAADSEQRLERLLQALHGAGAA